MKDTVAFCGLFCESCGVYIATEKKDNVELSRIANTLQATLDEIPCKGCRSSVLSPHCRNCDFRACAQKKNYENCEECFEFPCDMLKEFQSKAPHRIELFESALYRKGNGIIPWIEKMKEDYACKSCGTINSPYYISCKKCGENPGNNFIKRNIAKFKKSK
jgi:hypothetical protein